MTTKQEILAYAKQNGFVYPKFKVVFNFGLFGGMIGSAIFVIVSLISALFLSIFENPSNFFNDIKHFILGVLMIPVIALLGVAVGGIPALLTGIYLSFKEYIFIDKKDYSKLFAIGFLITAFCVLLTVIFGNRQPNTNSIMFDLIAFPLLFAIIGGISAMICGKLFLPKLPKDFEK